MFILNYSCSAPTEQPAVSETNVNDTIFSPPDTSTIPDDDFGAMVRYGRDLIVNTAYYIGPEGVAGHYLGNKMNCNNCHMDAGTRPYGLNYFSTHARYPQYRGRENKILTLAERVNNCIERPHLGKPLPLDSKEMVAITSYMKWLGSNVPVGQRVKGDNGVELQYPEGAADPRNGESVYAQHCASCHGPTGAGVMDPWNKTYTYPPLWGMQSYEAGSSMHRVLKMARFVKANMPHLKANWKNPVLTDKEAIDVAAFVNDDRIHARPVVRPEEAGYPNIKTKPIDYDKGPYADPFTEEQHKFGPYQPIIDYHKKKGLPIVF
ncbi:MAG: c-type cytochrome [Flavipsychrobacter sp.]|nr:c-type cytochrome [Flavipsychrobacter sp.]